MAAEPVFAPSVSEVQRYRPFLTSGSETDDWVAALELDKARAMIRDLAEREDGRQVKVLVLYGSLRERCVPVCAVAESPLC
jgi:hypothetical protein